MSTISSFKDRHDVYRGRDCIRKFFESLIEHAIKIIDFKKKKNELINKRTEENKWKCKNLLYL